MVGCRRTIGCTATLAMMAWLALLAASGCGWERDLPPQPDVVIDIPEPGTYNLRAVWDLEQPGDVVISGSFVYAITGSSHVGVYFADRYAPEPLPIAREYEGLLAPAALAVAKAGSTFVVVADSGDMRCKVYYWLGGEPLSSFTDSTWTRFGGIAADDRLRIFVADAERDTIAAYDRWGHPLGLVASKGSGSGYVQSPHGLDWAGGVLGVADTGKRWVQRLDPDSANTPVVVEPIGPDEDWFDSPVDVALEDDAGHIYVVDASRRFVLKFETLTGAFVDTVASPSKTALDVPMVRPLYVCANDTLVFVSEPDLNRILVVRLAVETPESTSVPAPLPGVKKEGE